MSWRYRHKASGALAVVIDSEWRAYAPATVTLEALARPDGLYADDAEQFPFQVDVGQATLGPQRCKPLTIYGVEFERDWELAS